MKYSKEIFDLAIGSVVLFIISGFVLMSCGKDDGPIPPVPPTPEKTFVLKGEFLEVHGTVKGDVTAAEAKAVIKLAIKNLEN